MSSLEEIGQGEVLDVEHRESRRRPKSRPAVEGEVLPGVDGPSSLEVNQLMVESERRHELEMRLAVLAIEYDRAMAGLQMLIKRYDELQAECEAARPPIHIQSLIPSILRTALKLARRQVRTEYPELQSLISKA